MDYSSPIVAYVEDSTDKSFNGYHGSVGRYLR